MPVMLDESWVLYMWDMVSRCIHVLDPRSGRYGYNEQRKERHELISSRLHESLFNCFDEYFAGWPVPRNNWQTKYPLIFDTIYSRYGLAILILC